jgi:hypothetical protein
MFLDRPDLPVSLFERDTSKAALGGTGSGFAGASIEDAFMARADEFPGLLFVVNGASEVCALLAIGDQPDLGEIEQDGLIIGVGVFKVERLALRQLGSSLYEHRFATTPIVSKTERGQDNRPGEKRA